MGVGYTRKELAKRSCILYVSRARRPAAYALMSCADSVHLSSQCGALISNAFCTHAKKNGGAHSTNVIVESYPNVFVIWGKN